MNLTGWGRYPRIQSQGFFLKTPEGLRDFLREPGDCIVHGMGGSYGDSALNARVILSRRYNKILNFDPRAGVVRCQAGITLSDLIQVFLPRGWLPAAMPGTRLITLGGAIAADVHGKNHHQAGCFSEGLISLELMLPGGQVVECGRELNRELFLATCGGMGLTGIILTAALRLQPVKSAWIRETVIRSQNLKEAFLLFDENQDAAYSVAWIDCLAKGDSLGRSVFRLGDHADSGGLDLPFRKPVRVPFTFPGFLLNRHSISWFNHLFYKKNNKSSAPVEDRPVPLGDFFFPLDRLANWNRLYGRPGLTQYQLVLPKEAGLAGITAIIKKTAAAGLGPFLGVLKLFGPGNDNYLSFPLEGYTLALDFKIQTGLFSLLDELDRIVIEHGGRLYLAKDVRMPREVFQKGYPRWELFAELREKLGLRQKFNSLQSTRLGV